MITVARLTGLAMSWQPWLGTPLDTLRCVFACRGPHIIMLYMPLSSAYDVYLGAQCWYGIMGLSAVCHTLNPRLFRKELQYIITLAGAHQSHTQPQRQQPDSSHIRPSLCGAGHATCARRVSS